MVREASLERVENGVRPAGEGWFVANARELPWFEGDLGSYALFDPVDLRFEQVGFGIGILRPGEANGMYHAEEAQEDFLVLAGECLLLIEGEERRLRAWDFVHCPEWTEHIFVGAGDGPCLVLAVGARRKGRGLRYPVSELALRHGAGVEQETTDPSEAYARFAEDKPIVCPADFPESE